MTALIFSVLMVHLVALASPGPDFFFVTQTAMSRSRREGLLGAAGIALGVSVWAALSLLGLQVLFEQFAWVQRAVMIAGAAYLLWMGVQLLRSALTVKGVSTAHAVKLGSSCWKTFLLGLFTNLANPKALIYFGSVFSLFVEPGQSADVKWILFLLISLESFLWFAFVTLVFSMPALQRGYSRLSRWIDGTAGLLFAGFSLALGWSGLRGQ
jgi:threonine efflux protein